MLDRVRPLLRRGQAWIQRRRSCERLPRRAILAELLERTTHLVIRGSIAIAGLCRPSKQVHRTSEIPGIECRRPDGGQDARLLLLLAFVAQPLPLTDGGRRPSRIAALPKDLRQHVIGRRVRRDRDRPPDLALGGDPTAFAPGRPLPARSARSPTVDPYCSPPSILSSLRRILPGASTSTPSM